MRGYISNTAAVWTFVALFSIGLLFGGLIGMKYGPEKTTSISPLARGQVKFLPFPPIKGLKTETIIWIDPGWRVAGATDGYLILSMEERPWQE
jgi:hypothetical protein